MTKRLIGIDIGRQTLRVAILTREQGELEVTALEESRHESRHDQVARLHALFAGEFHLGDRLAACLPSGNAFMRQLTFPFADRKKIAAALPFELAGQLPVSIDDLTTVMQPPRPDGEETVVVAAAVKTASIADFLEPFDALGIPLQILDLAPHAYVSGLKESLADGILVCATEQETSLALLENGRFLAFRQLPQTPNRTVVAHAAAICREAAALHRTAPANEMSLYLAGGEATDELAAALSNEVERVELLTFNIGRETIAAPFLPAVALALRAGDTGKRESFNLRQGPFALKGEWGGLRKAIILAACLAGLTLVTLGASMAIDFSAKRRQLDSLRNQMAEIYRQTIPGSGQAVDVPLQMQSAIRQLQDEAGLIGLDQPSAVDLLHRLSDLPDGVSVDLDEFSFEEGQVRIAGKTGTFEAVNRLAQRYRTAPEFSRVEVTESKAGLAGSQITFRMTLALAGEGGQP